MKSPRTYIRQGATYMLLMLLSISAQADVLVEAEVPKSFRIENLSDFPSHNFFYRYQTTDDDGSSKVVELPIKEGQTYTTQNGVDAILIARSTELTGNDVIANKTVSGTEVTSITDIAGITEVLHITELDNTTFALQPELRITTYTDGTQQQQSLTKASIFHFKVPKTDTQTLSLYIFTPIFIVLGLFLLQRKRRARLAKPFGRIVNIKKSIKLDPEPTERMASE